MLGRLRLLSLAALAALGVGCDSASSSSSDASVVDSEPDAVDMRPAADADASADVSTDAPADLSPPPQCEGVSPNSELTISGQVCAVTTADPALHNLFVTNQSSVTVGLDPQPDSDRDGIADAAEKSQGTDPLSADSDQDGYSDRTEGFLGQNPLDPGDAICPTNLRTDVDGDGLLACEEQALCTDPSDPDSDNDYFPDDIEVRFGTDPTTPEGFEDADGDGYPNRDEIFGHTDPLDQASVPKYPVRYTYDITQADGPPPLCYNYQVRDISISETADGWNTVLLYFVQTRPESTPPYSFRVACLRICRGNVPSFVVEVPEKAWKDLGQLQVPADCLTP